MKSFIAAFSDELVKLGSAFRIFETLRPALVPALATAGAGALIGSMATDPWKGMAVGGTLGLIPGTAWHFLRTNPTAVEHLKSVAAALPDVATGAGTGGAVGALLAPTSKERGHTASIGATLGGLSMGIPGYMKARKALSF